MGLGRHSMAWVQHGWGRPAQWVPPCDRTLAAAGGVHMPRPPARFPTRLSSLTFPMFPRCTSVPLFLAVPAGHAPSRPQHLKSTVLHPPPHPHTVLCLCL